MNQRILVVLLTFFCCFFSSRAIAEIVTTSDDQQSISLTIYNSNLALIRDVRQIKLPEGQNTLAFKEISSKILPETALLKGTELEVLEQNYEYDLLSPASLLQKYVGRKIILVRENPSTGEEIEAEAKVLSAVKGIVLQVGDKIETEIAGRIIYPDIPENLREQPTLTMVFDNTGSTRKTLELSYLSYGLSWKADYIALLNETEDRLSLKGWVTLTNDSGTSYRNAKLQLIAGDVHRVTPERFVLSTRPAAMDGAGMNRSRKKMSEESLFEYHLYTVGRPTTIMDNQSKQITLLEENNGICHKELLLKSPNPSYYWAKVGEISKGVGVDVFLIFKNDKESNLGLPKPAGTVRVYKQDSTGFSQFIGEDAIDHTPENEIIEIKLGKAFDVTADRVQTDFKILRGDEKDRRVSESEYEIELKNGKSEPVSVIVEESIPGDWKILSESHPHKKESSSKVLWVVTVEAKKSTTLKYRVRSKFL